MTERVPAGRHPASRGTSATSWQVRGRSIVIDRPLVVGILNITPDSFSDGGTLSGVASAVARAEQLLADGADLLDVGGESTRPKAQPVPEDEERRRVLPVIEAIHARFPDALISCDTVKSGVAAAAIAAGAAVINDVSGARLDPAIAQVCAAHRAGIILMHSRGTVADMASYDHASYDGDASIVVANELGERIAAVQALGVAKAAICLDPGVGFSKRSEHSLAVLAGLEHIVALGHPVMVGASRKRFIGEITGVKEAARRVMGTVGVNVVALTRGARLFRVHDVAEHRQALDAAWAVMTAESAGDARA